MNKCNTN